MTSRSPIQLIHDGRERPYLLQAPQTTGAGRLPLLLELHGRGIDPTRFDQLTGFGSIGFTPLAVGKALASVT